MTTSPSTPPVPASVPDRPAARGPRRVRFVMRDGSVLDAKVFLNLGQSLAPYLASRKGGWVNLLDVVWALDGERARHLVLQTDHVLYATSIDGDVPVSTGSSVTTRRWVQVVLETGVRLQGCLVLAERQRLSDYLYSMGRFLAVMKTARISDNAELGDVSVNCAAIKLLRDVEVPGAVEAPPPFEPTPYSVDAVGDTLVTRESIHTEAASLTLITPGRLPDRRAGESPRLPHEPPAAPSVDLPPLTAEQQLGVARAARHWLGLLGERYGMAPADARMLTGTSATAEIWCALCSANEIDEEELAALVGEESKLGVATFEKIDAKAVARIPGKLARRLGVLPVRLNGRVLHVATCDPFDQNLEQQLSFVTKLRFEFEVAPPSPLAHALDWWYPVEDAEPL